MTTSWSDYYVVPPVSAPSPADGPILIDETRNEPNEEPQMLDADVEERNARQRQQQLRTSPYWPLPSPAPSPAVATTSDAMQRFRAHLATIPHVNNQLNVVSPSIDKDNDDDEPQPIPAPPIPDDGFIDKNGKKRAYSAPPPPTVEEIEWNRITSRLAMWHNHISNGEEYPRMTLSGTGNESHRLLGKDDTSQPDSDFFSTTTVRAVVEAEDLLKPMALTRCGHERTVLKWGADLENELKGKNIRLADSNVVDITIKSQDGTAHVLTLGIRYFHISYRYFVAVILGGEFGTAKAEFPIGDRPFVAFYYVAHTVLEARAQRCM